MYIGYGIEYPLKLAKLHLSTPPANINNKLDSLQLQLVGIEIT